MGLNLSLITISSGLCGFVVAYKSLTMSLSDTPTSLHARVNNVGFSQLTIGRARSKQSGAWTLIGYPMTQSIR